MVKIDNCNCDHCGVGFHKKKSDILRTKSNFCSKECYGKSPRKSDEHKYIVKFIASSWTNMNIRCGKYKHLQTKSKCLGYVNVEILVSRDDFKKWCWNKQDLIEKLDRPSIDRIDKNGHYSLDNMQIIELSENIRKDSTVFTDTHGKCYRCQRILTIDKFCLNKKNYNGRTSICRKCESDRRKTRSV